MGENDRGRQGGRLSSLQYLPWTIRHWTLSLLSHESIWLVHLFYRLLRIHFALCQLPCQYMIPPAPLEFTCLVVELCNHTRAAPACTAHLALKFGNNKNQEKITRVLHQHGRIVHCQPSNSCLAAGHRRKSCSISYPSSQNPAVETADLIQVGQSKEDLTHPFFTHPRLTTKSECRCNRLLDADPLVVVRAVVTIVS